MPSLARDLLDSRHDSTETLARAHRAARPREGSRGLLRRRAKPKTRSAKGSLHKRRGGPLRLSRAHRAEPPLRDRSNARSRPSGRSSRRSEEAAKVPYALEEAIELCQRKAYCRVGLEKHAVRAHLIGFR